RGRRALTLLAGSTLLLIPAGLIEGLVSPRADVPAMWKTAVAATSGVVMLLWMALGRATDATRTPTMSAAESTDYSEARALISR
ncbi:MAG TPA: hypothetical protein VJ596_04405, partial [Gemmatimonadaceae bacterium]|nr:hypothetical protein [Gemmatimonadaceae bacterium]